jgi:P27 family predicted phage terminase small subunit
LALIKAEGNPGHRRLPKNEAKFKPVLSEPPDFLDAEAKKEWKRIGPELVQLGLFTSADVVAFASYCVSYSRLIKAQKKINRLGLTMKTGNNYHVPRPEIAITNNAMKLIKDFAIQFGFTPSARGRIDLPKKDDGEGEDLD